MIKGWRNDAWAKSERIGFVLYIREWRKT